MSREDSINRDHPVERTEADLERTLLVGQRTGRMWVKFSLGPSKKVTVLQDDLCDLAEWR